MVELKPLRHKSTNVLAVAFEGERRGNLHVQFHDGKGNPTSRGYYVDVPRAVFNGLEAERAAGKFIHANLKGRFDWVALAADEDPEITAARLNPDLTLPDMLFIPADTPDHLIQSVIDSQRLPAVKGGLFE